jgi:hypothetical protein
MAIRDFLMLLGQCGCCCTIQFYSNLCPARPNNDGCTGFQNLLIRSVPPGAYDGVEKFLKDLQVEYGSGCNFEQYAEVLSSDEALGYHHIGDIVDAVPFACKPSNPHNSSAPPSGRQWLKHQVDSASGGNPKAMPEGHAQAIFSGMWRRVAEIREQWAAANNT